MTHNLTTAISKTYHEYMDKKAAQSLDPKLKEVYERVMGTQVTPTSRPAAGAGVASTTPPAATKTVSTPVTPPAGSATLPNVPPVPQKTTAGASTFVAKGPKPENKTDGKNGISPIVLFLVGLIFFAIYTLFWLKFFNFPIPFLPQ